MTCREKKGALPSPSFNPVKITVDFKGQLLLISFSYLEWWEEYWGSILAQWKKRYQLVICLGNTTEELSPMYRVSDICALDFFLNITTFIELNFMEKEVLYIRRLSDLYLLNIASVFFFLRCVYETGKTLLNYSWMQNTSFLSPFLLTPLPLR